MQGDVKLGMSEAELVYSIHQNILMISQMNGTLYPSILRDRNNALDIELRVGFGRGFGERSKEEVEALVAEWLLLENKGI